MCSPLVLNNQTAECLNINQKSQSWWGLNVIQCVKLPHARKLRVYTYIIAFKLQFRIGTEYTWLVFLLPHTRILSVHLLSEFLMEGHWPSLPSPMCAGTKVYRTLLSSSDHLTFQRYLPQHASRGHEDLPLQGGGAGPVSFWPGCTGLCQEC